MADEKDFESMTVEQLDALLEAGEGNKAPEPPPEPPAEPEPEPTPPAQETPPVAEPVTPETPAEPEQPPSEMEELRALVEAERAAREADRKRLESLQGRVAGQEGFWKQKYEELQRTLGPDRSDDTEPEAEPSAVRGEGRTTPRGERPIADPISTWAVSVAVQQAAAAFHQSHPDTQEMAEEFKQYYASSGYDPSRILTANDPLEASRLATLALEEAYLNVKAQRQAKRYEELREKRATQFRVSEDQKRKAVISGSGGSPPPKPKPKSYGEMTADEADAELRRLYGDR